MHNLILLFVGMITLAIAFITFGIIYILSTALRIPEPYAFFLALLWSWAPIVLGLWEEEVSRFLEVNKETT